MLSLLLFKISQPGKPFVLLQNLKARFQPKGGRGSPLAASNKAGNTMLFWLWTSSEAISALCLSSPCLLLFLFPGLHSTNKVHRNWLHIVSAKCQRPGLQEKSTQRKFNSYQLSGRSSLYCSEPSNSHLSDCTAVSCNHHTHTQRKREWTGITHWVANYRV